MNWWSESRNLNQDVVGCANTGQDKLKHMTMENLPRSGGRG